MDANATTLMLVAEKTLSIANTATSAINTYLVFTGVLIAAIALISALAGIWLSYKFKQEKKNLIKEAKDELLSEIARDNNVRNALVNKILSDKQLLKEIILLKEFREQLDECVADHIDILNEYEGVSYEPLFDFDVPESNYDDEAFLKEIDITIDNEANLKGGEYDVK